MHALGLSKNAFWILQIEHRIGVRERIFRIVMGFHEERLRPTSHRHPHKCRDDLVLPVRDIAHGRGHLD